MADVRLRDEALELMNELDARDPDCADAIDDILEDLAEDPLSVPHAFFAGGGRITTRALRGRDIEVGVAWVLEGTTVWIESVTTRNLPPRRR
ncbi:hypothetical protein [Demequina sp.]|uniref:hypothetical protein n=1 Tax=Demequina sp. TaxID=2050685 RepID=UPI003D1013CB